MLANRVRMATFKDSLFIPEGYVLATDDDFSGTTNGDFEYIGTALKVVIPAVIKGETITSYSNMFSGSNVIGVVSYNKNITNMSFMFFGCSSLTSIDLSNFDTSNVTDMGYMFMMCTSLTSLDLSNFNTTKVTNMGRMFSDCSGLTSLNVSNFDTTSVTNMGSMFNGCSSLTSLDVSSFDTTSVTNMGGMFDGCSSLTSLNVSNFDTTNVDNMGYMFSDCSGLTSLDLSNFDTTSVTDMGRMFSDCSGLTSLDLSSFDTTNVDNMYDMFNNCNSVTTAYARTQDDADKFNASSGKPTGLNFVVKSSEGGIPEGYELADDDDFFYLDTSGMGDGAPPSFYLYIGTNEYVAMPEKIDGNVLTSYSNMFMEGSMFGQPYTPVKGVYSNNPNVTDMSGVFNGSQATTLDLSSFDTSNVTNMSNMFNGSQATTLDLSSFDTSNVTNMSNMFYNSKATVLDLSSFDTSNVNDIRGIFIYSQATTGYARTQSDADKFNASLGKPSGLNFIVKP